MDYSSWTVQQAKEKKPQIISIDAEDVFGKIQHPFIKKKKKKKKLLSEIFHTEKVGTSIQPYQKERKEIISYLKSNRLWRRSVNFYFKMTKSS